MLGRSWNTLFAGLFKLYVSTRFANFCTALTSEIQQKFVKLFVTCCWNVRFFCDLVSDSRLFEQILMQIQGPRVSQNESVDRWSSHFNRRRRLLPMLRSPSLRRLMFILRPAQSLQCCSMPLLLFSRTRQRLQLSWPITCELVFLACNTCKFAWFRLHLIGKLPISKIS